MDTFISILIILGWLGFAMFVSFLAVFLWLFIKVVYTGAKEIITQNKNHARKTREL
jgi:hypothetical protein